MKRLIFLIPLLFSASLMAQTCTPSGTVLNAATCSQADVNACFAAASNTTTAINIPSGTCTWVGIPAGTQSTFTVPSGNTKLVIHGNSTVNCTGTAGTSSYACTPTDNTVIVDNIAANFGVLQINASSSSSNPLVEVTGLTMQSGSAGQKFQGLLLFYSNNATDQLYIHNNHFNLTTGTSGTGWAGRLNNCFTGVGDQNVFDNSSPSSTSGVNQGFMNQNTCNDSLGNGDGSWAFPTGFGTSNFFFWENNVINGGLSGDCVGGGKYVVRYNTYNSSTRSSSMVHNHGTALNGGRTRSCRAFEAYHNYFNPLSSGSALVGDAGGSGLVWGNTVGLASGVFLAVGDERNDGQHPQSPTPGEWGYCGIGTLNPSGPVSNWDENVDSTGRACLDGIGRGQGIQALNGQNFPNALNSTTGTISWPEEYLEPVYAWMNTLVSTPPLSIASPATVQNRDIYVDNGSFTGATGTGFGTHAARLALSGCTAGPGGAYGASPTGSYGVGFWETDTNTFWACTSTNTWTQIYTPFTYPHPLITGPTGLWNSLAGWDNCILPGCDPGGSGIPVSTSQTIHNASPSLSGSSMEMSMVANAADTNSLWTWFGADCDLCTNFTADFNVFPTSNFNLGALELDTAFLFSTGLNREFMWGMQYCLLGAGCPGGHNSWDIWNQGTGTWIDTGITTPPVFGAWNHVQTANHRVGNTQVYDTLTLNGTLFNINMSEASSVLPMGWASGTGFQFQLDASTPSGSQTYSMYLDQAFFTSSTVTSVCLDPTQTGPNFSGAGPGPGGAYFFPPALSIGFTSPTSGCGLFATLDGSAPTCSSTPYSGTSSITTTTNLRVVACQNGFATSNPVGGTWTILNTNPPPPTITVIMISENAARELKNIREWRDSK